MPASTSFLNSMLNSGIAGVQAQYTGIYVGLYSGGAVPLGTYSHQLISSFDVAVSGTKAATLRAFFAPTGSPQNGYPYDEVRLYSNLTGVQLHSVSVNPAQFIQNGDVHQILVTFSGS